MRQKSGFTLIELLVVISIIALLIGILLPALGAARRSARQMKSNTQVRGIQQALVMFSQGNKNYYPGVRSNGATAVDNTPYGNTYNSGTGNTVEGRYAIMLIAGYFTGEYAISPVEDSNKRAWTTGQVTTNNYSFSMLMIGDDINYAAEPQYRFRREEWKQTLNQLAIVLSDRLHQDSTASDPDTYRSIHTETEGDWKGSVGWNDNHVRFETKAEFVTRYGNYSNDGGATNGEDILFDSGTGNSAAESANALMIAAGVDEFSHAE